MDNSADLARALMLVTDGVALQGNLDPLALVVGGTAMRGEVLNILAVMRGWPHIFNLGHGIVPETPPEHVAQLVQLVRSE